MDCQSFSKGKHLLNFAIQKEHFDTIELGTKTRSKPEILQIEFVDGLDRRYPVSEKQLRDLLDQSLKLPTTVAIYKRKAHEEDQVLAFKIVNPAKVMLRSVKEPGFPRIF